MPINLDPAVITSRALDLAVDKMDGQPRVAEMLLRQAVKVSPDNVRAISLWGLSLYRLDRNQEAIECFLKATSIDPQDADSFNNMALAYASIGEYNKSIESLEKALNINPNQHVYLNNLALQYRQLGNLDKAAELFLTAHEAQPSPMVLCNLGGLYADVRMFAESERCYREAIELDPDLAAPHVFLSYILGYYGDYEQCYREYEWRFKHFDQLKYYRNTYDENKTWKGESLAGRTILLYGEQGWGDQIQYVRYVQKLKLMNASTIVHCSKPLSSLFAQLPYVDSVYDEDIANCDPPAHDFHCSLISLPYLLRDFTPTGHPYIKPAKILRSDKVPEYDGLVRVGLAWAGSPSHPNDQYRSMPLKELEPLQLPGVKLFSLQVGSSTRRYTHNGKTVNFAEGGECVQMVDMSPLMTDYLESAAIVSGLDLVITVDTSLVHLCGALGVPCWVMLPYNSDWRWGQEGERTAWYESVRLFRQDRPGDWAAVVQKVRSALQNAL